MHEQTLRWLHAGFDSENLYTGSSNPQWSPTPQEFTAEMNVEVGNIRLEILLAQLPPPPQYDLLPRRSPAAGTGLDEPGMSHVVTQQTEQEETFSFQAGIDGFLCVDSTRILEQGGNLPSQADVGVKPEETNTAQVAARQEFVRLPKNR